MENCHLYIYIYICDIPINMVIFNSYVYQRVNITSCFL